MSDITVGIRLKADGSGLVGEMKDAKGKVTEFGTATDNAGRKVTDTSKRVSELGVDTQKAGVKAEKASKQVTELGEDTQKTAQQTSKASKELTELSEDTKQAGAQAAKTSRNMTELNHDIDKTGLKSAKSANKVDALGEQSIKTGRQADAAAAHLNAMARSADKMGKESRQSSTQVRQLDSSMEGLQSKVLGLAGIIASGFAVYQLRELADEATLVSNQLLDVASSSDALVASQSRVLATANQTRTSLSATADLYATLQRNARELVETDQELVDVVGTINKAFTLSGATVAETSGSIRQLSQALSSGVLRGDEFNSVTEQAPEILRAVQRELGKTKGEIRAMAAEGKITAEIVVRSLQNAAQGIDVRFQQTARTVEQSMTIARNNLIDFVGEYDEALGISESFGNAIILLSNNIDGLADTFVIISTLVAGKYVGAMASAVASKAALTRQALLATPAVTGLSASMGVQASRASVATIANNAYALSVRGASTALAFLGGPAGVAFAAAAAVLYFANTADDAAESTQDLETEIDKLVKQYLTLNNIGQQLQISKLTQEEEVARAKLLEVTKQLSKEEQEQQKRKRFANAGPASVGKVGLSSSNDDEIAQLNEQVSELERTINDISAKKQALFDSTFNVDDIKTQVSNTSNLLKAANDERLVTSIAAYRNETEALDRELQLQAQVRAGNLTQAEADVYSSLYRRQDANTAQYQQLTRTIETFYKKEVELAGTNKDKVTALEQQKVDKLAEVKSLYQEQDKLAQQEYHIQMEEANRGFWGNMVEHIRNTTQDFDTMWGGAFDRFAQGIGDATADAILEQQSFGDAARNIARSAIREVISGLVQIAVKKVALAAIERTIATTTAATTAATAATTGTAIAAAYTTPAALVSLASFGANSVGAMAGIGATFALTEGLSIVGQAHDGLDKNTREGTWWLRNDEMVLNPQQRGLFEQMLAANDSSQVNNNQRTSNQKVINFNIDARSAQQGVEKQIEAGIKAGIAEYDLELYDDFSNNGPRTRTIKAG